MSLGCHYVHTLTYLSFVFTVSQNSHRILSFYLPFPAHTQLIKQSHHLTKQVNCTGSVCENPVIPGFFFFFFEDLMDRLSLTQSCWTSPAGSCDKLKGSKDPFKHIGLGWCSTQLGWWSAVINRVFCDSVSRFPFTHDSTDRKKELDLFHSFILSFSDDNAF